LKLAFWTADLS